MASAGQFIIGAFEAGFCTNSIQKSFKVPVSPPASSQMLKVQIPFTSSPAKPVFIGPCSAWKVPVKGAEPVVIEGFPSIKMVPVKLSPAPPLSLDRSQVVPLGEIKLISRSASKVCVMSKETLSSTYSLGPAPITPTSAIVISEVVGPPTHGNPPVPVAGTGCGLSTAQTLTGPAAAVQT